MQPFLEHLHQLMQKICPFCKKKTCFFYFAHLFLQNSHISFSIIHIYSIKYLFFPLSSLSQTQHNPHSHHHRTTQQPSSSHTTTQPPSHSTKLPSMKFPYPFNQATINQPPKNQIQRSIINLPNHHHQATQQKSKDPITIITIINLPKSKDPKTHLSKSQNPLETKKNHQR